MVKLKLSTDFSNCPMGRYITDGPYSGEYFRDFFFYPKYKEASDKKEKLEINFDDCYGINPVFLEEIFGGMVRKYKKFNLRNIIIISNDDETIHRRIKEFVKKASASL